MLISHDHALIKHTYQLPQDAY